MELGKFLLLDESEQLGILHQFKKETGWGLDRELTFLLSGVNYLVKNNFFQDCIKAYQDNLEKDKEYFKQELFETNSIYSDLVYSMLKIVFLDLNDHVSSEKKEANEEGNFEYIPYTRTRFLALLDRIMKDIPGDIDFLDVGSGIGDKTMLASLNPRIITSWGIELNQHTFELSKFFRDKFYRAIDFKAYPGRYRSAKDDDLRYPHHIKFLNMDGLDFIRKDIDNGRKILFYSYRPILREKKLGKLYERFLTQMKIGDCYWEITADVRIVDKRKFTFLKPESHYHTPVWEKIDKNTFKEILCD